MLFILLKYYRRGLQQAQTVLQVFFKLSLMLEHHSALMDIEDIDIRYQKKSMRSFLRKVTILPYWMLSVFFDNYEFRQVKN